jgi:hypothetical protein
VLGGRKVYTGSGRMSLHPVFDGSRYRYLCCSMLVLGVTSGLQAGERGRKGSQVSYAGVVLKTTGLESYAKPWLQPPCLQVSPDVCGLLSSIFYLGSSRVRLSLSASSGSVCVPSVPSWPTSSFYRPRWGRRSVFPLGGSQYTVIKPSALLWQGCLSACVLSYGHLYSCSL